MQMYGVFFLNFLEEIVHEIWVGDIATPVI